MDSLVSFNIVLDNVGQLYTYGLQKASLCRFQD
jgi:hypothetical protein